MAAVPELVPLALGWIDAQKRAALAKLAQALSDPGQLLRPSLEAFAETPKEKMQRLVGAAGSVMPETREPALSEIQDIASRETIVPAAAPEAAAWNAAIKAGMTPEQAWQAIKVYKMPGGFLGKEVADYPAKAFPTLLEGAPPRPLTDILEHPELYKAMPELTGASIRVNSMRGPGSAAYFPKEKLLDVSPYYTRSDILHEVQHAVQNQAGWPIGGNAPQMAKSPYLQEEVGKVLEGYLKEGKRPPPAFVDPVESVLSDADIAGFQAYRHLAGEAQARATEARSHLLPEQAAALLPTESYDVPVSSLLFRYAKAIPAFAPVTALSALAAALAQQNGQAE